MSGPLLPCITLWQPYASLIFAPLRPKRHETRSRPCPSKYVGKIIGIHAAKKVTPASMVSAELELLCVRTFGADWRETLPRGALVGMARVQDCYGTERGPDTRNDGASGDWTPGRFAWRLAEPMAFAEPIVMPGAQGWFSVDLGSIAQPF
jgi:hypothetical protein